MIISVYYFLLLAIHMNFDNSIKYKIISESFFINFFLSDLNFQTKVWILNFEGGLIELFDVWYINKFLIFLIVFEKLIKRFEHCVWIFLIDWLYIDQTIVELLKLIIHFLGELDLLYLLFLCFFSPERERSRSLRLLSLCSRSRSLCFFSFSPECFLRLLYPSSD